MSHKKSLRERLLAFETALNDKADIFAGEALKNGKGVEKALKGRSNLANGDSDEPILIVDSTILGSVKEGLYITESRIYGKALYEDRREFLIETIGNIEVDEEKRSIIIDGVALQFGENILPKLFIISDCIREHIDSNANANSSIQKGRVAYIKTLCAQLLKLSLRVTKWNITSTGRITKVLMDNGSHMPIGGENLLERTAIAICRGNALSAYDQLHKEAKKLIETLNTSVPVVHANEQCKEYDIEVIEFEYDFGCGPDRNTSIDNDEWDYNTEKAFWKLSECGNYLVVPEIVLGR